MEQHLRPSPCEVTPQQYGERDEDRAEHDRRDRVDRPEPEPDDDGERDHDERVEDDLACGLAVAVLLRRDLTRGRAKVLFQYSLLYLALLFSAAALDPVLL